MSRIFLSIAFFFFLSARAEDLMSLLDADIHSAHPSVIIDADAMFSEDISYFGYPSFRRSSLSRLGPSRGILTTQLRLAEQRQGVGQALVAPLVMAFCGKGTQKHINETKQSCFIENNGVFILVFA